jgi:RNase adaptor protein for sRNA GlmZ degradation
MRRCWSGGRTSASKQYLEREKGRLAHARAHADLVVDTSELAAEEVRRRVLAALPVGDPRRWT